MQYQVTYAQLMRSKTKYDLVLLEPQGLARSLSISRWDTPGKQPGDGAWSDKVEKNRASFEDKIKDLANRGYKSVDGGAWPKQTTLPRLVDLVDEFEWAFSALSEDKRMRLANFLESSEMASGHCDEATVLFMNESLRKGHRISKKTKDPVFPGEFENDMEHLAASRLVPDSEPDDYAQSMPNFGAWA